MQNAAHRRSTLSLALALIAPLALLKTAQSQSGEQARQAETPAQPEQKSRALRRVIHLRSGTSMRVVARANDEGWEFKERGGWRTLPAQAIERVVLEKELMRDLRKQKAALPKDESRPRAELAGWMMKEGLLKEAFQALDLLLEQHPGSPAAREVLAEHAFRFRVPKLDPTVKASWENIQPLVLWALDRSPASRELATLSLEQLQDQEGLMGLFQNELVNSSPRRRAFAALGLRRIFPGEHVRALIGRTVLDTSDSVRREAALALRAVHEAAVTIPVLRALTNSSSERIRSQAAESLGYMGYAAAVGPMITRLAAIQSGGSSSIPHSNIFVGRQFAYVQDFDVEVAQFQAIADPAVNVLIEGQTTDAGVVGVGQMIFVRETHSLRSSLQKITGQRPGSSSRDWIRWWKELQQGENGGG